jgi:hypothetical protein
MIRIPRAIPTAAAISRRPEHPRRTAPGRGCVRHDLLLVPKTAGILETGHELTVKIGAWPRIFAG